MTRTRLSLLLAAPFALAACDSSSPTGDGGSQPVRLEMAVAAEAAAPASAPGTLVVSGSNGELTITDLRLVVAEFELDGDDDAVRCSGDDCEDFDAGPFFVDVALDGGPIVVTTSEIPAGTYRELEFEVEDLDDGEEDATERQRILEVLAQIRAQVPDWPKDASMLVVGSFRPSTNGTLGAPVPFRVFIDAEIEVEVGLNPPLVVTDASSSRTVSMELDPRVLFGNGSGGVLNLSAWNGQLVELELEIEDSFRGEGDDDSDDDDSDDD